MGSANSIETVLADFLRAGQPTLNVFDVGTDLIESGWMESLLVMDLVCFVQSRFGIEMAPHDICPDNLRSVRCLARYISGRLSHSANAA